MGLTRDETEAALAANEGLMRHIAYRWWRRRPGIDPEDVYAEVRAGFVHAAARADPARPGSFAAYAAQWGDEFARKFLRRELAGGLRFPVRDGWRRFRPHSMSAAVTEGHDSPLAFVPAREEAEPAEYPDDFWQRAVAGLTARQAEVLMLSFRDGLTLEEIGERFGVSRQAVCHCRTAAIRRLRRRGHLRGYAAAGE